LPVEVVENESKTSDANRPLGKFWWLSLIRGIVALLLGIALILIPISGKHLLVRYMGIFWLVSGASSLRWGLHGARATRLWLLAGIVGVLGGLVLIFHQGLANYFELVILIQLFALVAILTGLLHILGGYRIHQEHGRHWAWGGFFLGLVQIIMGVLILSSPQEVPPGLVYAAIIWALIGGIGFIMDAIKLRVLHLATR
jgi:uncharacterized membrane protein HdeD (DUF308 family)